MVRDRAKTRDVSGFFLHGESLRLGSFVSTLVASNLSLGNMVFVCAILGYSAGLSGVLWVVLTILALGLGWLLMGPRFRGYINDRGNFGTLHDFLAASHCSGDPIGQRRLKTIAASITCFSLFMAIVVEAHLGTMFASLVLGVPHVVLMALFVVSVVAYTAAAGFFAVVHTDIVQSFLLIVALVAAFALFSLLPEGSSLSSAGYSASPREVIGGVGWPTAVGLIVLGFFWLIATPDTWQRNAASRRFDTTLRGTLLGTGAMCVAVAAFAVLGMLVQMKVVPNVPPELSPSLSGGYFPLNDVFLLNLEELGPFASCLGALFATGLVMAAISTIDTFLVVIGHVLNVDLGLTRQGVSNLKNLTREQDWFVLQRGRLIILLSPVAILAMWFLMMRGGWLRDPLSLFFVTYTLQFVVAVPLLAATVPRLRSYRDTTAQLLVSTMITAGIGCAAMFNLGSTRTILGLDPASWMALLPLVPVLIGAAVYSPSFFRSARI